MENIAIKEIKRFQTDRGLHLKEYDALNEHTNLIEEILESVGLDVTKKNRQKLQEKWNDFVYNCEISGVTARISDFEQMLKDDQVDAYVDIVVFAIGAILKLGYEPELALQEGAKEINSRRGEMVNGKFEKDLSDEAKALWYKADYSKCKLEEK